MKHLKNIERGSLVSWESRFSSLDFFSFICNYVDINNIQRGTY